MTASVPDTRLEDHETEVAPLVAVYRHDVHKLRGRSHGAAEDEVAGVRVNETVPGNADRDAALLSRPAEEPEQTVANHLSPTRLSLLTGKPVTSGLPSVGDSETRALITPSDPERLHATWLMSSVPAGYNESVYYPYTSLKYHTLLTAALLDTYRAGFGFEELFLAVEDPDEPVTPHRTVLSTPAGRLCVTGEPGDQPAARLGDGPARCFADVWARLPVHPFDVDGERRWRVLDAQLRRIRSWSMALQFVEEYCRRFDSRSGAGRGGGG